MSNKNTKLFTLIWAVAFALYNIIAVILLCVGGFTDRAASFWISIAFSELALIAVILTLLLLGKQRLTMKDWLFGFPFIKHCTFYVMATLVSAIIFMIFSKHIAWWIPTIIFVIFLAIYAVFAISCLIAKNTIQNLGHKIKEKRDFINLLRVDSEMLLECCEDPTAKVVFKEYSDAVRYSDPMSTEALFELEKEIQFKTNEATAALKEGQLDAAIDLCKQAHHLLSERNKKCKALK